VTKTGHPIKRYCGAPKRPSAKVGIVNGLLVVSIKPSTRWKNVLGDMYQQNGPTPFTSAICGSSVMMSE